MRVKGIQNIYVVHCKTVWMPWLAIHIYVHLVKGSLAANNGSCGVGKS